MSVERVDLRGFSLALDGGADFDAGDFDDADLDARESYAEGLAGRLAAAVAAAREGRPIVYPTETVYGVGSGLSPEGVAAVRAAKGRADDKPVLALVDGPESVPGLAWTDDARQLAEAFWPGALTLVLGDPLGRFPLGVRSPTGTVAVRHSPHPIAAALVRGLGAPLTSSSANRPGEPPATDTASALAFAEGLLADARREGVPLEAAGEPLLVDAGTLPPAAPSTLVDCTVAPPRVLREGSIPMGRLTCVLPEFG